MYTPEADIKRSIYNAIRLRIVELGYFPDLALITTEEQFVAAIEAIRDSGKEIIWLYPAQTIFEREDVRINTIYLDWLSVESGSLKTRGELNYEPVEVSGQITNYKKTEAPELVTANVSVTIVAKTSPYLHLLKNIVEQTLGIGGQKILKALNVVGTEGEEFEMTFRSQTQIPIPEFMEVRYAYQIRNVALQAPFDLGDIAPTTEIVNIIEQTPTEETNPEDGLTYLNIFFQSI
jgi:hypothetical protein